MPLGTVLLILIVFAAINGILALAGLRPSDDLIIFFSLAMIAILLVMLDRFPVGG